MMTPPPPEVLERFALRTLAPPRALAMGTLNDNWHVVAARGEFVLRRIRDDQADDRLEQELETISFVATRGILVPQPLAPGVVRHIDEDRSARASRWLLLPFVRGVHAGRGLASAEQLHALGAALGRVHSVLALHPRSRNATFEMQWSVEESIAALAQIARTASERNVRSDVRAAIELQRRLLDGWKVRPPSAFAALPCQWLHGDYHEAQVLMNDSAQVVAVLDWEMCQTGARSWELVRALAFSGALEGAKARPWLTGYTEHVQLRAEELATALDLWWQSRVVGAWVWWTGIVENNARVTALFDDTIATLNALQSTRWREVTSQAMLAALRSAQSRH